jgi:hypothetical protein
MALSKEDKKGMIKLQNILFDTNEHSLMVTPPFLSECAKKYILKHLRAINTFMTNIKVTKVPAIFYGSIPPMREHLEALIKVEPYYDMSKPTPTAFSKDFEHNRNIYASNMVKRYVHETKQQVPAPGKISNPVVKKYYQEAFDELMSFEDQMQNEEKQLVDVFYSGLFKRNYHDPIPDNEYDSDFGADTEEAEETPEEAAANAALEKEEEIFTPFKINEY